MVEDIENVCLLYLPVVSIAWLEPDSVTGIPYIKPSSGSCDSKSPLVDCNTALTEGGKSGNFEESTEK